MKDDTLTECVRGELLLKCSDVTEAGKKRRGHFESFPLIGFISRADKKDDPKSAIVTVEERNMSGQSELMVDINYNDEQGAVRETTRKFADMELQPLTAAIDREQKNTHADLEPALRIATARRRGAAGVMAAWA